MNDILWDIAWKLRMSHDDREHELGMLIEMYLGFHSFILTPQQIFQRIWREHA